MDWPSSRLTCSASSRKSGWIARPKRLALLLTIAADTIQLSDGTLSNQGGVLVLDRQRDPFLMALRRGSGAFVSAAAGTLCALASPLGLAQAPSTSGAGVLLGTDAYGHSAASPIGWGVDLA